MNRSVLILSAAALVVVGIAPAQAASPASATGAEPSTPSHAAVRAHTIAPPRSVTVAGRHTGTAKVGWRAPAGSRSGIRGFTVTTTPAPTRSPANESGTHRVGARHRADVIRGLAAGTTYTVAVRTIGSHGTSRAVTATYATPPAQTTPTDPPTTPTDPPTTPTDPPTTPTDPPTTTPPVPALYALDVAGDVVRRPLDGSPATTVVANGAGYDVDATGAVYLPSPDRTAVLRVPATGGTPVTVATGLDIVGDLQLDAAGDVFFTQAGSVVELPAAGGPTRTVAPAADLTFVAPDGAVTTSGRDEDGTVSITTYPADGGTPVLRQRGYSNGVVALTGDAAGNVFIDEFSYGASGAVSWLEYPAGATDAVAVGDRVAYDAGALAPSGDFSLLQSATWCAAPAEASGSCTPDLTVADKLTRHADGTTSSVPVTGLSIAGTSTRGGNLGAADADGNVFVDIPSGPTAGLWEVPAAGGTAVQLDSGQFSRLMVV